MHNTMKLRIITLKICLLVFFFWKLHIQKCILKKPLKYLKEAVSPAYRLFIKAVSIEESGLFPANISQKLPYARKPRVSFFAQGLFCTKANMCIYVIQAREDVKNHLKNVQKIQIPIS